MASFSQRCSLPADPTSGTGCDRYGDTHVPQVHVSPLTNEQYVCCAPLSCRPDEPAATCRARHTADVIRQRALAYIAQEELANDLKTQTVALCAYHIHNEQLLRQRAASLGAYTAIAADLDNLLRLVTTITNEMNRCAKRFQDRELSAAHGDHAWEHIMTEMVEGCHPLDKDGHMYILQTAKTEIYPRLYAIESAMAKLVLDGHDPLYFKKLVAGWSAERYEGFFRRAMHCAKGLSIITLEMASKLFALTKTFSRTVRRALLWALSPAAVYFGVGLVLNMQLAASMYEVFRTSKLLTTSQTFAKLLGVACDALSNVHITHRILSVVMAMGSAAGFQKLVNTEWRSAAIMSRMILQRIGQNRHTVGRFSETVGASIATAESYMSEINRAAQEATRIEEHEAAQPWFARNFSVSSVGWMGVLVVLDFVVALTKLGASWFCGLARLVASGMATMSNFVRPQPESMAALKAKAEEIAKQHCGTGAFLPCPTDPHNQIYINMVNQLSSLVDHSSLLVNNTKITPESAAAFLHVTVDQFDSLSKTDGGMSRLPTILQETVEAMAKVNGTNLEDQQDELRKLAAATVPDRSVLAHMHALSNYVMINIVDPAKQAIDPVYQWVLANPAMFGSILIVIYLLVHCFLAGNALAKGQSLTSAALSRHETEFIGAVPTNVVAEHGRLYPRPVYADIKARCDAAKTHSEQDCAARAFELTRATKTPSDCV